MRFSFLPLLFCLACAPSLHADPGADPATSSSREGGRPERIVSLNGGATEVLFALGAGGEVVGRDESAYWPPEAASLPSIGYQFRLNAESMLSLRPTLVIGRDDAQPREALDRIRAAGVRVLLMPEPQTLEQAIDRVEKIGKAVGRPAGSRKVAEAMRRDLAKFRKLSASSSAQPRAAFLYFRGGNTAFLMGRGSGPAAMLEEAGAVNVFNDVEGHKPLTAEALVAARPDVIVLFRKGLEAVGGVEGLLKVPGVAQTPAGRNRRLVVMDDLYLSSFGPRAARAALDLWTGLHKAEGIFTANGDSDHESR